MIGPGKVGSGSGWGWVKMIYIKKNVGLASGGWDRGGKKMKI